MQLTVLGRWSPYPPSGGACPGYLVTAGATRILLDCGSGVVAALHRVCHAHDLTAAVITHLHPDHFSDVYTLQNALRFGRAPDPAAPPLLLYLPDGAGPILAAALPTESSRREFAARFAFRSLEAGAGAAAADPLLHAAPRGQGIGCRRSEGVRHRSRG